ncbi:MAG TPA: hypothetical protein PLW68_05370, partial [Casimicrobiaceae bacterium]|nr:hypothetical protein [Casimicrobiaceae bacterium]
GSPLFANEDQPFNVTVQAWDADNAMRSVSAVTTVQLTRISGPGNLGGGTNCTIPVGASECTFIGVKADTPGTLGISAAVTAGDALSPIATTLIVSDLAISKLGFVSVNGGASPTAGVPFPVVVESRNFAEGPEPVATATAVRLAVAMGYGTTGGTVACTIPAGGTTCTLPAVTYSTGGVGVMLRVDATGGVNLFPGFTAPFDVTGPANVTGSKSRKVHGTAGTFDLPLSLVATNPTTEPRASSTATIVVSYDKPIASAGNPTVSEGAANFATMSYAGNDVILNFTGVANPQYVTLSLPNVLALDGTSGGSATIRVGFLFGDANQSRQVTVADVGTINAALLQTVTNANYLLDVNVDGRLTVADKGLTNANLLKKLPAP